MVNSNLTYLHRKKVILFLTLGLTIFGLVIISSASVVTAARDFSDPWHFVKLQGGWALLGLIGMFFAYRLPLSVIESQSRNIFLLGLVLLVAVLIPGLGIKLLGARRWLGVGGLTFQPAELAKLILIIYLSRLLSLSQNQVMPFIASLAAYCLLVIFEPDLGTALVLAGVGVVMYWGSNQRLKHLILLLPAAMVILFIFIITSPYRLNRLKTYLDISHDPQGASYQIRQAILGLGSGGIFGLGLGQSRQKYEFLPEVTTDSIFAVVGEELGLVGTGLVLLALLYLVHTGLEIARHTNKPQITLLALGISSWIGIQSFLNIGALTALLPLAGIPLPFISYGGSAIVTLLFATGLLLKIAHE